MAPHLDESSELRRLPNKGFRLPYLEKSKEMNNVTAKEVYHNMIMQQALDSPIFPQIYWKDGCTSKMILFAWLAFHNRNLTWENLMKRG